MVNYDHCLSMQSAASDIVHSDIDRNEFLGDRKFRSEETNHHTRHFDRSGRLLAPCSIPRFEVVLQPDAYNEDTLVLANFGMETGVATVAGAAVRQDHCTVRLVSNYQRLKAAVGVRPR